MRDVVNNVEKFENLLTKICKDFKINNHKDIVEKFLKDRKIFEK